MARELEIWLNRLEWADCLLQSIEMGYEGADEYMRSVLTDESMDLISVIRTYALRRVPSRSCLSIPFNPGVFSEDFMEYKKKFQPNSDHRLADQIRETLRYYHYAYRTEQTYFKWI